MHSEDEQILSLGEYGSVRYINADQHLLRVERLSLTYEVMYRHSYRYDENGKLVSESLIGDLGEVVYESDIVVRSPFGLEECEFDENHNLIKHTIDDKTIDRLQKIAWWDWDIEKISKNLKLICHLDIDQLEKALD